MESAGVFLGKSDKENLHNDDEEVMETSHQAYLELFAYRVH
jgi:hypothetical protein